MRIRNNALIIVLALLFLVQIVTAIPNSINIQGKLTDSSGSLQAGTFNFSFKIYDSFTGGNKLYESNVTATTDARGVYDVILNNINISFADQLYLGVQVNKNGEMAPRVNLTSSPYSFRANISEDLNRNNTYEVSVFNITGNLTVGDSFDDVLTVVTGRLNISDGNIVSGGNLTLAERISFSLGSVIDNLVSGFLRINSGLNVTGNVSIAQDTLFVDNTSSRVGIGTSAPNTLLEVNGTLTVGGDINIPSEKGDINVGGGYLAGGITLVGQGDDIGSGQFGKDILLDGDIVSIYDVEINESFLPTVDLFSLLGNRTKRFLDVFTANIKAGNRTLNITGNVSIGENTLFVDNTSRNVGIGTSSPAEKLVVIGSVNISDSLNVSGTVQATTFIGDGSKLTGISTGQIWNSSGTNVFLNDSTAKVGIGTTSPTEILEVGGNVRVSGNITGTSFSINETSTAVVLVATGSKRLILTTNASTWT